MKGDEGRPGRGGSGRSRRLPDFVIGGAPRSGTTWLYQALDRHPVVRLARPVRPEPKFFLVDSEFAKGVGYYAERWFSGVPEGVLSGEKSTNYLESRVAAERMAGVMPGVKLIFVLREPASRAFSNYRFTLMNGLENLDFAAALDDEPRREQTYEERFRFSRPFSYFSRGLYADHLAHWLERFPREQLLITTFEELVTRPGEVLSDVHRFLGVEPRPADAEGLGVVNAADELIVDTSLLESLRLRYEEPNRRLGRLLGWDPWAPRVRVADRG